MFLFLNICAGASQEHLNLKLIGFPLNIAALLVGPSDEESPHPLRSLVRGNSLVVQGLGLLHSTAAVTGSTHSWGIRILQHALWDQKKKPINYQVIEWKLCLLLPMSPCPFHPRTQPIRHRVLSTPPTTLLSPSLPLVLQVTGLSLALCLPSGVMVSVCPTTKPCSEPQSELCPQIADWSAVT